MYGSPVWSPALVLCWLRARCSSSPSITVINILEFVVRVVGCRRLVSHFTYMEVLDRVLDGCLSSSFLLTVWHSAINRRL